MAVLAVALAIDMVAGDPPSRLHPVAWLGRLIAASRRTLCSGPPAALLVSGGVLALGVVAVGAATGWAVEGLVAAAGAAGLAVEGAALKLSLSLRGLARAARDVAHALEGGDLGLARERLGVHLVSRPTAALDEGHVASGAIESVAENLTDSLVAPVAFWLVLGLPGAFAYRALNTADTMVGYREGDLEYFGKVSARLDDAANLLPSRLAALALLAASGFGRRTWTAWRRDARLTASPNAGHTMAAMAGALTVTLEKPTAYRLGTGPLPKAEDIHKAIHLLHRAAALALGLMLAIKLALA